MSKYSEMIARIDERTALMLHQMKKMNASQGKQWDEINENKGMIGRLEERQKATEKDQSAWNKGLIIFSTAISAITGTIAGIIGIRR